MTRQELERTLTLARLSGLEDEELEKGAQMLVEYAELSGTDEPQPYEPTGQENIFLTCAAEMDRDEMSRAAEMSRGFFVLPGEGRRGV